MLDILIDKRASALIKKGFPWVYISDIFNKNSSIAVADPGEVCRICDEKGRPLAVGFLNSKTNICLRILTLNPKEKIDKEFFEKRFRKALERRFRYFEEGYLRLIYGESDGLPGLIVDVYGEYAVVQINAAGMENLRKLWLPALIELLHLRGVYLDAGSKHRAREGLDDNSKIIYGDVPRKLEVRENGISYFADIFEGQKTGWFYDQRENRKYLASLAAGKSFLDLYTHSGGFGLLAAACGATYIELVDRSELALELAEESYTTPYYSERHVLELQNLKSSGGVNVSQNIKFIKADVFNYLDEKLSAKDQMSLDNNVIPEAEHGKMFDIVNADPPAFIKNKNDVIVGLKGYEKLTRKCLPLVKEGGVFAISSCSYFARPEMFQKSVESMLTASGRKFKLLRKAGADKDHPIHPMLDETNYLKFLVYRLDQ